MPAGWLAGTWINGQWPARAKVISRRSTSITPYDIVMKLLPSRFAETTLFTAMRNSLGS